MNSMYEQMNKTEQAQNEMTELGIANSWKETPEILKECRKQNHVIVSKNLGRCYNQYCCTICNYHYTVDSSD